MGGGMHLPSSSLERCGALFRSSNYRNQIESTGEWQIVVTQSIYIQL